MGGIIVNFLEKIKELEKTILLSQNLQNADLQRTEKWHKDREGNFTGSKIKDLMSCNRSVAKKDWGDPAKIFGLGDGALTYVYEKTMERKHGFAIKTPTTAPMRHGTQNENVVKIMYEQKFNVKIDECAYIPHPNLSFLGASPDGKIGHNFGVEIKCPTTWSNFMQRIEKPFDKKHIDFWQVHTEMLCLGVNELVYIVALPVENIFEPEIKGFEVRNIKTDKQIQHAIEQRAIFANEIVEYYLKSKKNFYDCVKIVSEKYI